MSTDPLGFDSGDYNLYRYGYNNPVKYLDPTGHCAEGYMGDAYEDYGCLEIAMGVSAKYKWSFSKLAKWNWTLGRKIPENASGDYGASYDPPSAVEGGNEIIGYELLELDGRAAQVDGADVYSINFGDSETQYRALVKDQGETGTQLSNFRSYANAHAKAQEDYWTHGRNTAFAGIGVAIGLGTFAFGAIPEPASPAIILLGAGEIMVAGAVLINQLDEFQGDWDDIYQNSLDAEYTFENLTDPNSIYSQYTLAVDLSGN